MLLSFVFGYVASDMIGFSKSDCINIAFLTATGPILLFAFELFDLLKKKINDLKK